MGRSFNRHAGAIDWIQSRFRNRRPATLYFDEVRSCTYTDDLNPEGLSNGDVRAETTGSTIERRTLQGHPLPYRHAPPLGPRKN